MHSGPADEHREPRNAAQRAGELQDAEILRALAPARLATLRPRLHEKRFERRQVLYFEGSPADRLWLVRAGQVRLYKGSSNGLLTTLDVLGPGEAFGVVSALDSDVYPAGAEAVTAGSAWWLPREAFRKLLDEEPGLHAEILRIVSRRLRDAQERLRSFAHDPAPARLALALLRAAGAGGEAHVTRRALAEAAGTTVETAIRVLRRFAREGLVEGRVGCLRVLDEPALRRIAGA